MPKKQSTVQSVVRATLDKISSVTLPNRKFIIHIFELWLSMNCRHVFSNMGRWGSMAEQTYRGWFARSFDWFGFNYEVVKEHCDKEIIAVFDPSYIKKSGKQTFGLGMFWSGVRQKALKGLEIGCLAFVDVAAGTALHGEAVQTPPAASLKAAGKTLVTHYVGIILKRIVAIKALTGYLAVDGYFMKKEFIEPLLKKGLHVVTKTRSDANLNYVYKGVQKQGRGRKKIHDGKISTRCIDKRRLPCCYQDEHMKIYSGVVYCVLLKKTVLAAFIYYGDKEKPEIIVCTDTTIEAMTMCKYYGLRFQVEFLIRDAKQHAGLEDCMARDGQKLETHFNISMTAVSLAKSAYHLSVPQENRGSFSMTDIKMYYMNQLLTKRIFSNLDLDMSCKKIKHIYNQCLNFGRIHTERSQIRA